MLRIGSDLLKQSKASHEDDKCNKSSRIKHILSLLVQANAMQDLPKMQRMKDEGVLARVYKLILDRCTKRSPPSSLATKQQGPNETWSRSIDVSTDNNRRFEWIALLDAVVRETLRLYPLVSSTVRAAEKDDCIPP
ncbi:hypothetical protein BYT27DRAFT_7254369 [Phlegmacium glaucopus]|nr:hypothetical protein BYT27DRAFT_7254369 [Phlegmacium glaucopus]